MALSVKRPSITVTLLQSYFSVTKDLKAYLLEILEPGPSSPCSITEDECLELTDADSSAYSSLINTTYVAFNVNPAWDHRPPFKVSPPMADMREVLDKAQEKIFRNKNSHNIITAGYRRAFKDGDRGKQGMTRVGITNHFINTIVTALQSPEWAVLLKRIGVDAMLHLLSETSIFISLPNGCLCQMTGEPIISAIPMSTLEERPQRTIAQKRPSPFCEATIDSRPIKRHKTVTGTSRGITPTTQPKAGVKCQSPIEISLVRAKLFYARPKMWSKTHQVAIGLPEQHILNRICPSRISRPIKTVPNTYIDPDPREQQQHARHLSKYIFARQYCLSNPFAVNTLKRYSFGLPDYEDRETEIKAIGSCKTPKRLKEILPPLETMLWRHGKCAYKPLKDQSCPSKLRNADGKQLDSSIILDCISEQSILLTQLSVTNCSIDSSGNSILPLGLTQARQHAKLKPRFADFACSFVEVYRYVTLVTKAVIPKVFWGNDSNFKVVLEYVKQFIQCRRFETLTLHHILQGLSTSACDWLAPPGSSAYLQTRVSVSDALKRRELLEDFIFWYFDSFVSSLLKTNFYITETSAFRNRVLYFRHDDWDAMCAPLIDRLAASTFMRISDSEAAEVLRQRRLGFSFVRLLPKETGVRPIVNLRRQKTVQKRGYTSEQSINQILQAAFHILSYEKQKQPNRLGASVFSPDDVYMKLKEFKLRLPRQPNGKLPRLYFVKVDVQACFDTIEQTRLLEILRELISEDIYMTQRYGQVQMSCGRLKRTFVKKAGTEDDHPHFLTYAAQLAGALRNIIFVDQVVYPYSQKSEILSLLEEHITENIVKIGSCYYRQTIGIPQGSILSALLCSFFYGDLEKQFTNFSKDLGSVLLRLIDDYLFITTSRAKALEFLTMMQKGHPEYGCFISKEKTLTNFDYDAQISNVIETKQQSFPWCSYLINMTDLSISSDYSRYHGTTLRDTLTIGRGRKPGVTFAQKMLWLARTKCKPIYSDPGLNTVYGTYLNVYQNFLLCAMKMHGYLYEPWSGSLKRNTSFIYGVVQKMISTSYTSLQGSIHKARLARDGEYQNRVEKFAVTWLGTHAFYTVLKRKQSAHISLLRLLSFELSRPRSRHCKKRFSSLTKEGLAGLTEIAF